MSSSSKVKRFPVWVNVFSIGLMILLLEQHSRLPEADLFLTFLLVFTMPGLLIYYLIQLIRIQPRALFQRGRIIGWLVVPVSLLLMISSAASHWPAELRFRVSRSEFEQLLAQAQNGQRPEGFPRRIGWYWIEDIHDGQFDYVTGKGTIAFETGEALIDPCGLEFSDHDPGVSTSLHHRVAAHWYLTEW